MNRLYPLFFCMVFCLCARETVSWHSFCCLKTTQHKGLSVKNVADCKVQHTGLCPFDAIIIKTNKGRTLCYDLKAEWVIKNVVMKGKDSCEVTIPQNNPYTTHMAYTNGCSAKDYYNITKLNL
ncbi:uncharacterized protein ccl32b.3 [Ictalurus punctatus]|uniref:Uncharacterized protein ccl32b.3 n=1 Tax=Ictalurus punctatus TaxID=7998 RepID=A0A2D0PQ47_ICTPU|nr:uncharacterized protein ccl32b.3 [Ictalurus punctatus]